MMNKRESKSFHVTAFGGTDPSYFQSSNTHLSFDLHENEEENGLNLIHHQCLLLF